MPTQARVGEIAGSVATGNSARIVLGQALRLLSTGYALDDRQVGSVQNATTEYLDGIRVRAEADFAALPVSDELLPVEVSRQIAFDVASIEAAIGVEVGTFTSTAIDDFLQPIEDLARAVVPDLPKPPGGFSLWIVGGVLAAIVILYLVKK